jgi:hypothetical protein
MQRGLDHFRTTLAASEFPVGTQPRRVQVLRLWDATARDPIFVPLRLASAVEKLPIEDQYAWKKIWEQIESTSREFAQ